MLEFIAAVLQLLLYGPLLSYFPFALYLQELVQAYAAEAKSTGNTQLMLTAAVSAGKGTIDNGYEIAEIAKLVCCYQYLFKRNKWKFCKSF